MRAIDTNVLVRLVARDDAKQVAVADEFVAQGAWVSHLVLVETVCILTSVYDLTPTETATAVEMFLNHKNLVIQDSEVVEAALARFRKKRAPGFSDCLVLEVARKAGHLPLGTFDQQLGKLDGAQPL